MGRKIPGRKHRGVKDPEKQAAARLNSIKDKINAPPANPDVQEIPKTLQKIIDLKNKTKSGDFKIKKIKKKNLVRAKKPKVVNIKPKVGDTKSEIPKFEQLPGESDRDFVLRVNKICQNVTKEAAFQDKYGVDIVRDAGELKLVKRSKDELEILIKDIRKAKKAKRIKKKKKGEKEPITLTKSQKWEKKKKEKKLKKAEKNVNEFEKIKDLVKFGEVVHGPPTLTPSKKIQKTQLLKPAKKRLLLTTILDKSEKKPILVKKKEKEKKASLTTKTIDKKGKRKNLPNALRRKLEKQQQEVITAYKFLKKATIA